MCIFVTATRINKHSVIEIYKSCMNLKMDTKNTRIILVLTVGSKEKEGVMDEGVQEAIYKPI